MFAKTVSNFGARVSDTELTRHLRQTFNYMTGGVALSGLVAWFTLHNPAMLEIAVKSHWVFFAIWLGFAFFAHKIVFNLQPTAALGVFAGFSALTGFSLAPVALVYTGASVVTAFVVACAMFAGASVYGYTTKKSMSGMGTFLTMASIGLLVAIVVNIFLKSSTFSFFISLGVVPLIAIGVAYELNQIKEQYAQFGNDEVMRSRVAILSATSLYMSFIVLFIHLLNILGVMRDE